MSISEKKDLRVGWKNRIFFSFLCFFSFFLSLNPFKSEKSAEIFQCSVQTELVKVVLNIAVHAQILIVQEQAAKCDFAG